ncbi:MAG: glycosyltransferase family 4 protein [Candidatus Eisenbacteria sp.]|nr:glycosyltransferase family 4 protein [Candidatus Eisenbacteria bacterium]
MQREQLERKIRVAMIGHRGVPATYGGVERHVEELATRLVSLGFEVLVLCRSSYTPPRKEYRGVEIICLPTINQKHVEMIVHTFLCILHLLFLRRVDIIHIHSVDPAILTPLAKLGGKVVVTSHGQAYRREKWGPAAKAMSQWAERVFVRWADGAISVSKTLRAYYQKRYGREVTYIPNGVNVMEPGGHDELAKMDLSPDGYVLYVGRLVPTKGAHTLIEAFQGIQSNLKVAIAGGSSHTSEYVDRLEGLLNDRVRLLGYQYGAALQQLYENCRLFVLPSQIEGLPITLLEAMSYGKPILFSDIPENLEAAEGVGVSFHSGDADDLRDKLVWCFEHPDEMLELGSKARERVIRDYAWDQIAEQHADLYRSVLAR